MSNQEIGNHEITALLSNLLERDCLGSGTWAKEVKYSKFDDSGVGGRVDYMSFRPERIDHYRTGEREVQRGIFTGYEIKSCLLDFKSGVGLNFICDRNYLVVPMTLYNELLSKKLIPENVGIISPVPTYKGKQTNKFFDDEIRNPTPLTTNDEDWRMHEVRRASFMSSDRRHGTAELLYAMLRAKR